MTWPSVPETATVPALPVSVRPRSISVRSAPSTTVPATRKLFAPRSEAIASDAICSAGRAAISLPVELELELLGLGAPLDPVPLLALEQPGRITLAERSQRPSSALAPCDAHP